MDLAWHYANSHFNRSRNPCAYDNLGCVSGFSYDFYFAHRSCIAVAGSYFYRDYACSCNLKKFLDEKIETNVNALEGQTVLVVKPILKFQKGEVKVANGVIWSAKTADGSEVLEASECKVVSIEGNTLIVQKI